jgi:vancomycin resistance protein YoaR
MVKAQKAVKKTNTLRVKTAKAAPPEPTKGWLRAQYARFMPKRRRYQVLVWAVVVLAVLIIAAQLLYPRDRGLPLASAAGRSLSLASHETMAKTITDQFDASKLRLTLGRDKSIEYALKSTGAEPNTEEMIKQLSDYPLWQRFIPGSILLQPAQLTAADVYYTSDQFVKFVDARSKELTFAPQNARLAIDEGTIVATEAVAGSEVKGEDLLHTISLTPMLLGKTTLVEVPSKRQPPTRTSKDLSKVRAEAEAALAHTVTITAGDQQFVPTKSEIASWVLLSSGAEGEVTLSVDREKIKAYLVGINTKVGVPAGQTNISIVDGREVGRTAGAAGRSINVDALAEQLGSALLVPPQTVAATAQFVEIQPSIIFNSKYTATQAGLQAYADDIARSRNMRISIQQLDGGRWSANARATESIPSASTYKLFVALVLFDKMDKGEIHWNDPMLDTTVAGCFERMTVASTNPCAEKWIAMFGREYINNFIYARGFSRGTSFTTGSANQTTAADLTKYMIGLNDGTLVGGSHRDRLLDSLGRHPYGYGIPTGSKGVVHDKVGFLWDYVHDTAIVQHPRGTYIMTVMTKGQSYAAIATVTREVERIMYP